MSRTSLTPKLILILLLGISAVSTAAIFIRLAQEESAPSLTLAAARMVVASLTLTPIVLTRHRTELRAVHVSDLRWALLGGLTLGLHFATWIASLEYTAVINSVVLVTTMPLWVALLAVLFLREKMGQWAIIGLGLSLAGGVLVGLSGNAGTPPTRNDPMLGNGLALAGAVAGAIYFTIGRRLRARLGLNVYIWLVYSTAALLLVIAVLISGTQITNLPTKAYLWMILMGLVPQLIGHSSFNYALGFLPAAYVSLIVLGEPVGSGLLAMVILGEWPVALQLVGAAFILGGIWVASRERQEEKDQVETL